jgi:hypothetical protein
MPAPSTFLFQATIHTSICHEHLDGLHSSSKLHGGHITEAHNLDTTVRMPDLIFTLFLHKIPKHNTQDTFYIQTGIYVYCKYILS